MLVYDLDSDATSAELNILTQIAACVPATGIIVEIGTGRGGTALALHQASKATVYTIDPYTPVANCESLVREGIVHLLATSQIASTWWSEKNNNCNIDLLLIDGAHDFLSLWTDVSLWFPRLYEGSMVIFDDYEAPQRGGLSNLAVKIIVDMLIQVNAITKVQHESKLLMATVNRSIEGTDIDVCWAQLRSLDMEDGTNRAKCERLASMLPMQFWELYDQASQQILFRQCVETFNMLQLATPLLQMRRDADSNTKIEWVSRIIALKQVELNILKQAIRALYEE